MNDDSTMLVPQNDSYDALLADLRAIIASGRGRRSTPRWSRLIGRSVSASCARSRGGQERAGYGERLLAQLGKTLSREFGRGFAEQSLRAMRQFYTTYPNRSAVRSDLGWTHDRTLMRLPDDQRDFYAHLAVTGRWSGVATN